MGHLGFLIPVTKYHILEIIHLCKTFNPHYLPQPVIGIDEEELEEAA
jgi:hypothetical protein